MLEMITEYFMTLNWAAVAKIIMIDILLGGDNAVIIALACRDLPAHLRKQGILWGTAGAILMRVVLIFFAVQLLSIPFLKIFGGVLLLWVGVKLMIQKDGHGEVQASDKLWGAIKTIVIADFVMSFDNVIAIAAAAQQADPEHQMGLIIFGLLLSIPIIVWGSQFVIKLLDKYPSVITFGAGLLGWIAGSLIVKDVAMMQYWSINAEMILFNMGGFAVKLYHVAQVIGALFVMGVGYLIMKKQNATSN
jgi:YjbE family integral membrane protein